MDQKSRPSLSELAEKTGLNPAHISKVLNGRPCRGDTALKIASAMGITVDELYRVYIYRDAPTCWGFR